MQKKLVKIAYKLLSPVLWKISMPFCSKFQYRCLSFLGVGFGQDPPRYLAGNLYIDGGDYSLTHIGSRVTISSHVRILTHDWSLDTLYQGIYGTRKNPPIGKHKKVVIGDDSFIGAGVVILPGCEIGKCCIIGAGSVVRGKIPDFSIAIGNPAIVVKDTRTYLTNFMNQKNQ